MTRALKFVRFADIEDYFRLGWMTWQPNEPTHHNHYGIVMRWICDCKIPGEVL